MNFTETAEYREYLKALTAHKRASNRHNKEQERGRTDGSVRQTSRMALAVASYQRASFRLRDAVRACERLDTRHLVFEGIKRFCN